MFQMIIVISALFVLFHFNQHVNVQVVEVDLFGRGVNVGKRLFMYVHFLGVR